MFHMERRSRNTLIIINMSPEIKPSDESRDRLTVMRVETRAYSV